MRVQKNIPNAVDGFNQIFSATTNNACPGLQK
jgi:hypothetical protein